MLPALWVDKIFAYMSGMYGRKFSDMWQGTDLAEVKILWAEKLAGFENHPEAIKRALEALESNPWPPTLPEFLILTRAALGRLETKPKALDRKFTEEEIKRNKERLAKLINQYVKVAS